MPKKSDQLNVKILDEKDRAVLLEIEQKHGIPEVKLVREFIAQVRKVYETEGYFALPFEVRLVKPEKRKRA